jgi:hypothetical protein
MNGDNQKTDLKHIKKRAAESREIVSSIPIDEQKAIIKNIVANLQNALDESKAQMMVAYIEHIEDPSNFTLMAVFSSATDKYSSIVNEISLLIKHLDTTYSNKTNKSNGSTMDGSNKVRLLFDKEDKDD